MTQPSADAKPLSADGVELKVGMKVWYGDDYRVCPPKEIGKVDLRDDSKSRVMVKGDIFWRLPIEFYATEHAYLEHRIERECNAVVNAANDAKRAIARQQKVQSRLAALTAGERTL